MNYHTKQKLEAVVNQLLTEGSTIKIDADLPFAHPETRADSWTAEIVAQYVQEKLDLPQYQQLIKNVYLHGLTFISLHENLPYPGFEIENPLHKLKILSHAEKIRNIVLKRAARKSNKAVLYWDAANTAFWLKSQEEVTHYETSLQYLK
jgi:hypothetical protein